MKAAIVHTPFADYAKGDEINDPETLKEIAESHLSGHVVMIEREEADAKAETEREPAGDEAQENAGE